MLLPLLVDPVPLGVKLTTWTLLKHGIREGAKRPIGGTDHVIGLAFSFGVFSAIDDPKPVAPTQGKKIQSETESHSKARPTQSPTKVTWLASM